jgi:cytochrome c biogenesis protein CcmG, thiol:disulfide interchange protein DsbE
MSESPSKNPLKRKNNLGVALFVIGLFLVGTVLIFYLSGFQQKALDASEIILPPATVSYAAPKLSLTGLDDKTVSLEDYHGKVVLVNNWATWCPPCKDEMPELQAYYSAHIGEDFIIVAIESGESAATVMDFVQNMELSFPVWLDPQGLALAAFKNWDLPSSYLIDRNGIVRMIWTGPLNRATLEKYITPLLEN